MLSKITLRHGQKNTGPCVRASIAQPTSHVMLSIEGAAFTNASPYAFSHTTQHNTTRSSCTEPDARSLLPQSEAQSSGPWAPITYNDSTKKT